MITRPKVMGGPGWDVREMPGYRQLDTVGGMAALFVTTIRTAARPPYSWKVAFLEECSTTVRRCAIPLALSMAAFAIGIVLTLIGGLLGALGTLDRSGGGNITGWTREPGFWVTSMIFAGVAGSAMTADLAARKVREELDAIAVLGVDSMRTLIVPRILALAVVAPLLGVFAVVIAMGSSMLTYPLLLGGTRAAFVDSTLMFMNVADLASLLGRLVLTGFFVGTVCCYKGLSARGGAEGVGRAVNESVLICFVGLWVLNCLWNAVFLANSPITQVLRG